MRLLLDTHIFLWTLDDSPRLSRQARETMTAPGTECFVSAVSFWEIAIKASLRRREFRVDAGRLVAQALTEPLTLLTQDAALARYGRNVSVV